MSHQIGDRASCGDCGRILTYTSAGWDHAGLNKPRHMARPVAMPIDETKLKPMPPGGGVWVGDAPEDEPPATSLADIYPSLRGRVDGERAAIDNTIHNLTTFTRLIASELASAGVHPNVWDAVEYQIHQLWSNALRTTNHAT